MIDEKYITITNTRRRYNDIPCVRFDNRSGIMFYKTLGNKLSNFEYYTIELNTNTNIVYFEFSSEFSIRCFKLSHVGFSIRGTTTAWKKLGIPEGTYKAEWIAENKLAVNLNEKIPN